MKRAIALTALLLCAAAAFATEVRVVGKWYDDLRDPQFADATLIIEQEGTEYFLNRRNGDGSGGRYKLLRSGDTFTKIGDKFGAKYVISREGLEIHDRQGYIRTAKKID